MKDLKIIYTINPVFKSCPECHAAGTLHRSRARSVFEQILKRISFYNVYRCKNCGWRGYLSTLTITRESFRNLIIYLTLMGGAAFIIRFIVTKFLIK